ASTPNNEPASDNVREPQNGARQHRRRKRRAGRLAAAAPSVAKSLRGAVDRFNPARAPRPCYGHPTCAESWRAVRTTTIKLARIGGSTKIAQFLGRPRSLAW